MKNERVEVVKANLDLTEKYLNTPKGRIALIKEAHDSWMSATE